MKNIRRYLYGQVMADLKKKMVFVAGPRQVGKTTMARTMLPGPEGYLNWDIRRHRDLILREEWPAVPLLVLDEVHKFRKWRNMLKGLFDQYRGKMRILVTGSARLDYYRFGGDSLQGRYHLLHLYPLSVAELGLRTPREFNELLSLGGFPEPYYGGSQAGARRWSREYRSRLLEEDLRDLESIHDIGSLEQMMIRLPDLVGSPLSINSLREDLQLNHRTVARWACILERIYAIFRLPPLGAPRIRAVKKEQKHYHLDWTLPPKDAQRFENLVAVHLKKWVELESDARGRELELRYFRDVQGREVDFVIVENRRPVRFIECKWGDEEVQPALRYARERFPEADFWQISAAGTRDYHTAGGIRVCPALTLLSQLA
ncbi:MAG: ATP-binding protein [Elusimicrobia bacterium]|nr:ATP-binding protein [Elusimicrobiota bacterium]